MTYEKAVTSTQYYDEIARRLVENGAYSNSLTPADMADAVDEVAIFQSDIAYESGFREGYINGEENGWNDGYDSGYMDGEAQGLIDGETQGRQAFWDDYFKRIRDGKDAAYTFAGQSWNSETFYPTENIVPKGNGTGLFSYFSWYVSPYIDFAKRLEECGVSLDTQYCTVLSSMFSNCFVTRLPKISVISGGTGLGQTFNGMAVLKTIDELNLRGQAEIDAGKTYNTFDRTFKGCSELENITVTGIIGNSISFADSSKLTAASVDSIIDALKTLEDGDTAKTLTLHATVKTNMTDTQTAAIAEKGWSLA